MLKYEQVSYNINGAKIINDISMNFRKKELVAIVGENGAGKTTLFNILYHRKKVSGGNVYINNTNIKKIDNNTFYQNVVMLSQDPKQCLFEGLTLKEHIILYKNDAFHTSIKQIEQYLNFILLEKINLTVDSLSGGQRQTFAFALTMLKSPQILLLDEHTSALDANAAEHMMQITKEVVINKSIVGLMISHNIELTKKYADRVILVANGKISFI
ncbi:MAG: ABC transporter ATP-binding protein [Francisellaceae bacterium]|jgi:ABC-type uncharacterized transport system ATPase component|nr:ABC transporter ATP-binding protein [Francisellaceae bacterium]MBT6538194.1 ABC transporter ATP-binding protein [Francisellaceae bacterium]